MTNNTIRHCSNTGIYVWGEGAIGNRDLTIQNNFIDNTRVADALTVYDCNGADVVGNTFAISGLCPAIAPVNCTNIDLVGNLAAVNGVAGQPLVSGGTQAVQGLRIGIFVADVPCTFVNQLSGLVLDDPAGGGAGTQTVQQTSGGGAEEHWTIVPGLDGYCTLVCAGNGLALGVNNSSVPGAPIILEPHTGADDQLWTLLPRGSNSVALVNKLSGLAAQVPSNATGAFVTQEAGNSGSLGQQWSLLGPPEGWMARGGNQQIWLLWNPSPGASYALERSTVRGGPYTTIATGITAASFYDLTLSNGITYYYVISTVQGAVKGPSSVEISVTPNAPYSGGVLLPILVNPSFELDTFATIPGYVKDNGPIRGWFSEADTGINPTAPFGPANNYSTDNGTIPDGRQAAFLQQDGALRQVVKGLVTGATYRVDYWENRRLFGGAGDPILEVRMAGQVIVPAHLVPAVGGANPYVYVRSQPFVASRPEMELAFVKSSPAPLDRTVLIDDVRVMWLSGPQGP